MVIQWGEWHHFGQWTSREEDWRHGNTLKFTYDAAEFWQVLVRNCGGDQSLAHRLKTLLERRTLTWTLASQVKVGVDRGGWGGDRVQIEIVPFPADWTLDGNRLAVGGSRGSQDARKLSLMTVRWLMRWLLEERRDFDPTMRGSTVRPTARTVRSGSRRERGSRPGSVLG